MEVSFEAIQAMCDVCEATGCWHWKGGVSKGGAPQMREGSGRDNIVPVRRVVLRMMGKWRKADFLIATNTCMNKDCVAPEHAVWLTRKELQQRTAKVTRYGECPERRMAIAKAMRARSSRTIEQVREMRASGLGPNELARKLGQNKGIVAQILRGDLWKDYENPFSGLMR